MFFKFCVRQVEKREGLNNKETALHTHNDLLTSHCRWGAGGGGQQGIGKILVLLLNSGGLISQ